MKRRTRARVSLAATVVTGAGAYVVSVCTPGEHGHRHGAFIALGAALTVATGAIPTVEEYRQVLQRRAAERLAKDAAEDLKVTMSDALEPITRIVGEIRAATDNNHRHRLRGEGIQAIVDSAAQLIGTDRARASFYRIELVDQKRQLVPDVSAGRSGKPKQVFKAGTVQGNEVLKMVDGGHRLYCPDVTSNPPPGWSGTTSGYQTFVAVSVRAGRRPYGMLTLDALKAGDLAVEEEVGLVDVFANLIGAILSA